MKTASLLPCLAGACLLLARVAQADPIPPPVPQIPGKPLIDPAAPVGDSVSPSSAEVTFANSTEAGAPGIVVTIAPGKNEYPGITLKQPGGPWDLSAYGHVTAKVVNTGTIGVPISLRLDNDGNWQDSPWNVENTFIKPGATGTVTVFFGYSFGHKPSYQLKPGAVTRVLFFSQKAAKDQTFRIESLEAGGPTGEKPPIDPNSIRTKPKDGMIVGPGVTLEEKQIVAKNGAQGTFEAGSQSVAATFTAAKDQAISITPAMGSWDLRDAFEVAVKIKNTGAAAISPSLRANSKGGATATVSSPNPIAPGASGEIAVNFAATVPWTGIKDSAKTSWNGTPGTGTSFTSDAVGSVTILPDSKAGAQSFVVQSIKAGVPTSPAMPEWLGKKPPVEGEWVQTFNEEFEGKTIDLAKWNIYAPNYWDKKTHFSKDNVVLGEGTATLHYEKKTGTHNDDPAGKKTDYTCGYFDTYGKWVQRYGYFEARMKLPHAPGLWPAFWLMPDRGVAAGPQWKRSDTGNAAMEFDIMEYLSRWGIYRFNIAMHWNGYGKDHQQTGTTCNYVLPDKDGFITIGLLWTPGLAVYYGNGKEILRWESARISNVPSFLMFDMVSGGWDNDKLDDSKLPDDFVVDYVRAWQRKDLASDVDGVKSTDVGSAWPEKAATPTPTPVPTATPQPAAN